MAQATGSVDDILDLLESELAVVFGDAHRIEDACERLRHLDYIPVTGDAAQRFRSLAGRAATLAGPVASVVVGALLDLADNTTDPWPLLADLVASRQTDTARRALDAAARLHRERRLQVDLEQASAIARLVEVDGSPLADPSLLGRVGDLVELLGRGPSPIERLTALYRGGCEMPVRRLAARLLDRTGTLPSADLATRILGSEAVTFLAPYLAYTRANHLDLLDLAPDGSPPALRSLRDAEEACGESLLREILAKLGWRRVAGGLEVRPLVGVSVGGSFPLVVTPGETSLLEECPDSRRVFDRILVLAHGGAPGAHAVRAATGDAVARFRAYNVAHAELLGDLLAVEPLTANRVRAMLARLDQITADFTTLFAQHTDECRVLPERYAALKAAVLAALGRTPPDEPLGPEATRLVQMFEDPGSLAEVRTLHGLKRYLHQKGLRLGLSLATSATGTNRTVSMVLASSQRVLHVAPIIEYADFEDAGSPDLPYAVRVAAEGLGWQLLHGVHTLPKLKVFCYGTEVHYFIAFKNHPAFARIDYSPPLRGGMIDLEYYGVSKYELDTHPDPSLGGILRLFQRLDFEASVDNTRIHARYDKERARDLTDLCDKVEAFFRLAAYLMDVDWVLGDLALSTEARQATASAWADFFADWGTLPMLQFLTRDRRGILAAIERDPAGDREVRWLGRGPYRDRFSVDGSAGFWGGLETAMSRRGLARIVSWRSHQRVTQVALDRAVLRPLRAALARGEIEAGPDGLQPAPPHLLERPHEARAFADLLQGDVRALVQSADLAQIVGTLERHLRFDTTGAVNGYDVQRSALPLRGQTIGVSVLRDDSGIPRLALWVPGGTLVRRRRSESEAWQDNAVLDPHAVAVELRRNNLPSAWIASTDEAPDRVAAEMRARFASPRTMAPAFAAPGETMVPGLIASPGRAVGLARLGLEGRSPEDLEGAVLIAPTIAPQDCPFLYRAAGVVSTGGGILSHAGLLAQQFGKPALVVAATWAHPEDGEPAVVFGVRDFDEQRTQVGAYEIAERQGVREREGRLHDGDLLVLDTSEGVLRVLGQDRDALTLHDNLHQLAESTYRLRDRRSEADVLVERGRRVRARHQLEKTLARITAPALARHAVRELLTDGRAAGTGLAAADRVPLLHRLLDNPAVGHVSREAVQMLAHDLARHHRASLAAAMDRVPASDDATEILWLRLDALERRQALVDVRAMLEQCGIPLRDEAVEQATALDGLCAARLSELRGRLARSVEQTPMPPAGGGVHLRAALEAVDRIDSAVDPGRAARGEVERVRQDLGHARQRHVDALRDRVLLYPEDGGLELQPLVGSKAANLAEAAQLGAAGLIPRWFVATDRAFREVLTSPLQDGAEPALAIFANAATLEEAIDRVLASADLSDAERARLIRQAWEAVRLPDALDAQILEAYHRLGDAAEPAFVAIRSSAHEEDTLAASCAGEFDTFLFVRGDGDLRLALKHAWSGLWSERALHNRAVTGRASRPDAAGGGVLVQRMVDARAAGVLHTVNIAGQRLGEMIVNAGLGLGEGIVSGVVAADHIVVDKSGDLDRGRLHFRYVVNDKRERVVRDARAGSGTLLAPTLSHQRLRPALEYVELLELVQLASRLERAFGYPLDLEFAFENAALRLLQVRPVPAAMAVWRDTIERHPIKEVT